MARFLDSYKNALTAIWIAGLLVILAPVESIDVFAQGEEEEWLIYPHEPPLFKGRKIILKEKISKVCGSIRVTGRLSSDGTKFESLLVKGKMGQVAVPTEILDMVPMPAKHSLSYLREVGCEHGRMYAGLMVSFIYGVPPEALDDPHFHLWGYPKSAVFTIRGSRLVSWKYQVADADGNHTWIKTDLP